MDWFTFLLEDRAGLLVAIVTLLTAIIGTLSATTVDGLQFPKNVTSAGWVLVSIAIFGFGGTAYLITARSVSDRTVELAGLTELEGAQFVALEPFFIMTDDPHGTGGRYDTVRAISGLSGGFFCNLDIHDYVESNNSAFEVVVPNKPWAIYLAENAELVRARLIAVVGTYGPRLDTQTVLSATSVASDPWLSLMVHARRRFLSHLQRGIDTADPRRRLCTNNPRTISEYKKRHTDFLEKLSQLEALIETRQIQLTELLNQPSCPPFEKTIYGNLRGIC